MKKGKLRPLKDGSGYSICYAADENVGKRRCNHTLEGHSYPVQTIGDSNFVEINDEISAKEAEQNVKSKVKEISKRLTVEEKNEIRSFLRMGLI